MDEATAQIGAQLGGWVAAVIAAIVFVGIVLDKLRGTVEGGGNFVSSFLAAQRRVATERQSAVDERMRRELDGLGKSVDRLQAQVNRQEQQIEDLRADNAEIHAYAWRAYDRVLKHEPDTDFPSPREHMAAVAKAAPLTPQESP